MVLGLAAWGCSPDSVATAPQPVGALARSGASVPSDTTKAATFAIPTTSSTISLTGDGLFASGSASQYTDGQCGIVAVVYAPNPYRDANLQTDNPTAGDRKCSGLGASKVPRKLSVRYPLETGWGAQSLPGNMNVRDLGTVTADSLTVSRPMSITLTGGRCARINFGNLSGGTKVNVTRTGPLSWHVESPAGGNVGTCGTTQPAPAIAGVFLLSFDVTRVP